MISSRGLVSGGKGGKAGAGVRGASSGNVEREKDPTVKKREEELTDVPSRGARGLPFLFLSPKRLPPPFEVPTRVPHITAPSRPALLLGVKDPGEEVHPNKGGSCRSESPGAVQRGEG